MSREELPQRKRSRTLYLVGGADSMKKADQDALHALLNKATRPLNTNGFSCQPEYILSGGTDSGVSKVAAKYGKELKVPVHGWLPRGENSAQEVIPHPHKESFSIDQPLEMWKELEHHGAVKPASIAVVATSGGEIANAELAIAAACNLPIALLPFGDPEKTEEAVRLFDPGKRQLVIPNDPMALRAFLLRSWGIIQAPLNARGGVQSTFLEQAALKVHKNYRAKQSARANDPEPAEESWRDLQDDLKQSNLDQAAAHIHYFEEAGIGVSGNRITPRAAEQMQEVLGNNQSLRRKLAKLEHGRWMIERMEKGVKRGPRPYRGDSPDHSSAWTRFKGFFAELFNNVFRGGKTDKEESKKEFKDFTHSDLVAWRDLPWEVKSQDYDAIDGIPEIYEGLT